MLHSKCPPSHPSASSSPPEDPSNPGNRLLEYPILSLSKQSPNIVRLTPKHPSIIAGMARAIIFNLPNALMNMLIFLDHKDKGITLVASQNKSKELKVKFKSNESLSMSQIQSLSLNRSKKTVTT